MNLEDKETFTKLVYRFVRIPYVSEKSLLRSHNITKELITKALLKKIIEIDHEDEYDIYYHLTLLGKKYLE